MKNKITELINELDDKKTKCSICKKWINKKDHDIFSSWGGVDEIFYGCEKMF
jgi:hypothetical protein